MNSRMKLVALIGLAMTAAACAESSKRHRFIYNTDGGNMFIDKEPPMKPADVYSYVDEVAGTGITTFFVCPNFGMPMSYPSKVTPMIGDGLTREQMAETRKIALEKPGSLERGIVNLRGFVEQGHDPLGVVIDRAREKGLEVFITFRLNEIHNVHEPDSTILTPFWHSHPEWRVGKLGDKVTDVFMDIIGGSKERPVHPVVASWFPGALNFAVPEVRALRLAELRECCERYPIDGLDLDFQRFPIYFPQDEGREHTGTMTAFVREVRKMTNEVGRERGRPLLLSARVLAKPEQGLAIGLDPATWVREGLLDLITVSHYLRNDFRLPISQYRKLMPDIPLYGSIEVDRDPEVFRRIARELWQDGVDGVLLFNFFTSREAGREPLFELLNELGDPDKIKRPQG